MLHARLMALFGKDPELAAHKRRILGGCCRTPSDATIRRRLRAFLMVWPEFTNRLTPLLGP